MKNNNKAVIIVAVIAAVAIIAMTVAAIGVINKRNITQQIPQQSTQTTTSQNTEKEVTASTEYTHTEEKTTAKQFKPNETKATTAAQFSAKPGNSVSLTDKLQYDVNIYLSNFSEVDMKSFSGRPSDEELANFGMTYNFINRNEKTVEYGDYNVNFGYGTYANVRIKESYVIQSIKKFLGITVQPGFANEVDYYSDGYFYMEFTGAHLSCGFTVVKQLTKESDGLYKAEFAIYESGGSDSNYYSYSYDKIESCDDMFITKVGQGTAYFTASNINDRTTYILTDYRVTR